MSQLRALEHQRNTPYCRNVTAPTDKYVSRMLRFHKFLSSIVETHMRRHNLYSELRPGHGTIRLLSLCYCSKRNNCNTNNNSSNGNSYAGIEAPSQFFSPLFRALRAPRPVQGDWQATLLCACYCAQRLFTGCRLCRRLLAHSINRRID